MNLPFKKLLKLFFDCFNNLMISIQSHYLNFIGIQKKILLNINKPTSIIFVCQGNICRSPFAQFYLTEKLTKKGNNNQNLNISSAGLITKDKGTANPVAIKTAKFFGLDLNTHSTKQFTENFAEDFELIVVFEKWHKKHILKQFPHIDKNKIILLGYLHPRIPLINIRDPYGKDNQLFLDIFHYIAEAIDNLSEKLFNEKY